MDMLLHTNANIIAVEPNPDNLFRLLATVDALPPYLKSRITIFNFAVGSSDGTAKLFAARGKAVQVEPMKSILKPPRTKSLNLGLE
jgi:hypothetical protein